MNHIYKSFTCGLEWVGVPIDIQCKEPLWEYNHDWKKNHVLLGFRGSECYKPVFSLLSIRVVENLGIEYKIFPDWFRHFHICCFYGAFLILKFTVCNLWEPLKLDGYCLNGSGKWSVW